LLGTAYPKGKRENRTSDEKKQRPIFFIPGIAERPFSWNNKDKNRNSIERRMRYDR